MNQQMEYLPLSVANSNIPKNQFIKVSFYYPPTNFVPTPSLLQSQQDEEDEHASIQYDKIMEMLDQVEEELHQLQREKKKHDRVKNMDIDRCKRFIFIICNYDVNKRKLELKTKKDNNVWNNKKGRLKLKTKANNRPKRGKIKSCVSK